MTDVGPHQLILDVDTGIDDALAICFAIAHPHISVLAIACVAGNTAVDQVLDNTLRLLDLLRAGPIPVATGARRPLLGEPLNATHVHGTDGMGDLGLSTSRRVASPRPAIAETSRALRDARGSVTYVCLGPTTNLALLLRSDPDAAARISRILIMGGASGGGNASAVAEYNVWHDPEAAHIVATSGLPVTMFTLDAFRNTIAEAQRVETFYRSGSRIERMIAELLLFRPGGGTSFGLLGDAAVLCTLVAPHSASHLTAPVAIDISNGPSRGQTLLDRRHTEGEDRIHGIRQPWPRIDVIDAVNAEQLNAVYFTTLHRYATAFGEHPQLATPLVDPS